MPEELSVDMQGLELLASLYTIRSENNSFEIQRTCNFCISKVLNALTDDISGEISQCILDSVSEIVDALNIKD